MALFRLLSRPSGQCIDGYANARLVDVENVHGRPLPRVSRAMQQA